MMSDGLSFEDARDPGLAIKRGFLCRCPACGGGGMFRTFLKTRAACDACGQALDGHRADDGPLYLVILIVGHVVVGLNLALEQTTDWPMWVHFAIWPALALVMSLALLQPMKGALIGYQWALKLHGFDPGHREGPEPIAPPKPVG